MKIKNTFYIIMGLLLCIITTAMCMPFSASARTTIDTSKTASMKIQYPSEEVTFHIYRIASVNEVGEYTVLGLYQQYLENEGIQFPGSSQEEWDELAAAFSEYAEKNNISPDQTKTTDSNGELTFSSLPLGMYLVVKDSDSSNHPEYVTTPFLASLPELNGDDNWVYNVNSEPKFVPVEKLRVIKIWKNEDNTNQRPASIEVQLLRNGAVVDTVTLNKKNNWQYTWDVSEKEVGKWEVVEKTIPAGYTSTIDTSSDSTVFIITNTFKKTTTQKTTSSKLPQTGQVWWPIPILLAGGILFVCYGRRLSKKN